MIRFKEYEPHEIPKPRIDGFKVPVGFIAEIQNTAINACVSLTDKDTGEETPAVLVNHADVDPASIPHEHWRAGLIPPLPNGSLVLIHKDTAELFSHFDAVFHVTPDFSIKAAYLMNPGYSSKRTITTDFQCAQCDSANATIACECARVYYCSDFCRIKAKKKRHTNERCEEMYAESVAKAAGQHRARLNKEHTKLDSTNHDPVH